MAEAIIYIDGEIVSSIDMTDSYPYTMLAHVRDQLEWQKPFDSIRAKINSPGGSANEGLAIRDYLKSFNVPLHTEGIGFVASIATAIFAAGETRSLSKHCKFFIHLPYGGIDGNADEIVAYGEAMRALEDELINIYDALSPKSREELIDLCRKQTELSAAEALEYGFATSIAQEVLAKLTDLPNAKAKQLNPKNDQMNEKEKSEFMGLLSGIGEKLNKLIGRKEAKALALTIVEDGRAITISGETEQAEEGQEVTLTDSGEALPDGTYALSNGQTITVADGVITSVSATEEPAAENAEVTALKAELETLKAAKQEAEAKAEAAEIKASKQSEEIKALSSDFKAIKSKLESTGTIPRDENTGNRKDAKAKVENSATSALDAVRAKREERKNQNKK